MPESPDAFSVAATLFERSFRELNARRAPLLKELNRDLASSDAEMSCARSVVKSLTSLFASLTDLSHALSSMANASSAPLLATCFSSAASYAACAACTAEARASFAGAPSEMHAWNASTLFEISDSNCCKITASNELRDSVGLLRAPGKADMSDLSILNSLQVEANDARYFLVVALSDSPSFSGVKT